VLGTAAQIGGYDVVEMAIAANGTGLLPDIPELHCPTVRTTEIPEVLCPAEEGGILGGRGIIEVGTCLRHPAEAGLGGGVFVVVDCANDYSRYILTTKGLIPNSRGSTALIYRPYHLCGVETSTSILAAELLGVPTGAARYLPRVDVVARATRDLGAGERVGGDDSPDLQVLMQPAQPARGSAPLPLHMANGCSLTADVPSGSIICVDHVSAPLDSALWSLRAQQDEQFLE
jgi:predicted homoserine dehydrogenase-like protein